MSLEAAKELAPNGALRAAINMSNFLLVTGKTATGEPDGVSPDMARELAKRLSVDLELLQYKTPGEISDDAGKDIWDIGNIGAEPKRAEKIDFTAAYCEIQSTYMVPPGSEITSLDQVDQEGVRIAVSARSAYDLWLERNIKNAELVRVDGIDASFDIFMEKKLEALAGLRPRLITDVERVPGAKILEGQFTAVQQAMGCTRGKDIGARFLKEFVEEMKSTGFVGRLIEKHDVVGRLSVAGPA
jgi:polar amino acid transport system substrate-binding protein